MSKAKNITSIIITLLLIFFYGSFLFHKINLTSSDLGRHLKNGQLFWESKKIISTNFYSYTQTNFFTLNHHWGSGAIFFAVFKFFGFLGLHLFFILFCFVTFLIFFSLAKERVPTTLAGIISLPIIFLLAERTEIRPEIFSYFFGAIFFYFLLKQKEGKLNSSYLFLLPILQIAWVNLHIFFFLGPFLILSFFLESLLTRKSHSAFLLLIFIITLIATFVNPHGIKGALDPFWILNNYGYRIVENQNVFFLEKLIANPNFLVFKIVFVLLALIFAASFFKNYQGIALSEVFIIFGMSFLAWYQIRNFALFGFFLMPIAAGFLQNLRSWEKIKFTKACLLLLISCVSIFYLGNYFRYFPYWKERGLGLEKNNLASLDFFKKEKIGGPIFNNYDIGGFLIFGLNPFEKVFVDNRPEAYPAQFFQDTYIPMLTHAGIWQKMDAYYQFNTIFFNYKDATPWGQNFLMEKIKDPQWSVVYVDNNVIIFLRKNIKNEKIISAFEIPKERFINSEH